MHVRRDRFRLDIREKRCKLLHRRDALPMSDEGVDSVSSNGADVWHRVTPTIQMSVEFLVISSVIQTIALKLPCMSVSAITALTQCARP